MMAKWFTSSVIIVAIAASASAGMLLHAGEQECSMKGKMDCCETARGAGEAPEISAARLCCAVNCPPSGTTVPAGAHLLQFSPLVTAPHPAVIQPVMTIPDLSLRYSDLNQGHLQTSHPAYIRHLALLI